MASFWRQWRRDFLLNLREFHGQPVKGPLIGEEREFCQDRRCCLSPRLNHPGVSWGWLVRRNSLREEMVCAVLLKMNFSLEIGSNFPCNHFSRLKCDWFGSWRERIGRHMLYAIFTSGLVALFLAAHVCGFENLLGAINVYLLTWWYPLYIKKFYNLNPKPTRI